MIPLNLLKATSELVRGLGLRKRIATVVWVVVRDRFRLGFMDYSPPVPKSSNLVFLVRVVVKQRIPRQVSDKGAPASANGV